MRVELVIVLTLVAMSDASIPDDVMNFIMNRNAITITSLDIGVRS